MAMRILFSLIFLLSGLALQLHAQEYEPLREEALKAYEAYDFPTAISKAEEALAKAKKKPGQKSMIYGVIMVELGTYQYFNYDTETGMANIERGLDIAEADNGASSDEYWGALSNLGIIHYFNEDFSKAIDVFEQTVAGMLATTGAESMEYGYEVNKLGLAQVEMGMYEDALKNFNTQLVILDKNNELGGLEHATLLNNIGFVYQDQGAFDTAEGFLKEAVKISKKVQGKEGVEYANNVNNLAILYTQMGRYDEGLAMLEEIHPIYVNQFGKESLEYAQSLNNMGNIAGYLGQFAKNENLYLEAKAIKKRMMGEDHASYIRALNNLGTMYLNLGRYNDALALLEECISRMRPKKDEDPLTFSDYALNLAGCYRAMGRYAESNALYEETMAIYVSFVGERHWVISTILVSMANLRMEEKKFKEAEQLFKKALEIYEENGHENTYDYIVNKYQLGMAYMNMEDYERAEPHVNAAVEMARKMLGEDHPDFTTFLINQAYMYHQLKKDKEAQKAYISALDSDSRILRTRLSFMSAEERSEYWKKIQLGFAFFNNFCVDRWRQDESVLGKMYDYQLATKSMILQSNLKLRKRIMESGDQDLIANFQQWKSNKEYLNKLYSLPASDLVDGQVNIDSLEDATEQLEKLISDRSGLFAERFNKKLVSWSDIQQKLDANEAAIEIIRAPNYGQLKDEIDIPYVALVLRKGEKLPRIVVMENGRNMDNELSDYYFSDIFAKKEDNTSYNVFWEPIDRMLDGIDRVYLSTDGIYNIMNVNTLRNPETGRYVLDDYDVWMVTNTADVIDLKQRAADPPTPSAPEAHLFGYPNYYLDLTKQVQEYKEENAEVLAQAEASRKFEREFLLLADLPGTKVEVNSIEETLANTGWKVNKYLGDEAVEERIKELKNPTVLHLSTHGFFEFGTETEAAEKLKLTREAVVRNPLLRSGIMMAGSGFSLKMVQGDLELLANMEDGILTGYEATALDLDETELVVLSACLSRVGRTPINDKEGYYGMLRAFMMSGAKAVVASSWAVDDRATQELMVLFYHHWGTGMSKHDAFRQAQLDLKKSMPEPYLWGAFIMVGK